VERFVDKVVVVTGGANGIGRSCCHRFASEGAAIVVADRDGVSGAKVVDELVAAGARAVFTELDATSRLDNAAMADAAIANFGRLDSVITAAGISHAAYNGDVEVEAKRLADRQRFADQPHLDVLEYDVDEFRTVMEVNVIGTFLAVQACAEKMVELGNGGSVVTIASIASKNPNAGPLAYTASKSAVWMMTKKLGTMLASADIRINAIGPGFIETNMTQVIELMPDEQRAAFMANIPLGRKGQPEDIAATAAFLCSDDARYFTGEILHPSGGYFTG
jgi:NAD(P)-dependent dehydrogenase (short-subunit alcohol dehydrogenase family)